MFSPVGKKKLLLRIKRAKGDKELIDQILASSTPSPTKARALSPIPNDGKSRSLQELEKPSQKNRPNTSASSKSSPDLNNKGNALLNGPTSAPSIQVLESILQDDGPKGKALRALQIAAARYRPERDAISMKSFNNSELTYKMFKTHLRNVLRVNLDADEFKAITQIFDPSKKQSIDGYGFIVSFIKLATLYKDKVLTDTKLKEEVAKKKKVAYEERKEKSYEKRLETDINMNFNEYIQAEALEKVTFAAKKFDPSHPSAPNLDGFQVN
jgi:hypothetical protein